MYASIILKYCLLLRLYWTIKQGRKDCCTGAHNQGFGNTGFLLVIESRLNTFSITHKCVCLCVIVIFFFTQLH